MLWNDLRYIIMLSTVNLRWKNRNILISIIIISLWTNAMARTASPWWDVWCQVAVMTMLLWAGFADDVSVSSVMRVIRSEMVFRDKLTLWNSFIFFWCEQLHSGNEALHKFTLSMRFHSFLAISSLTTTKLACIPLSWSTWGLDKTGCWPIKLHRRAATSSTRTCPFHTSCFAL